MVNTRRVTGRRSLRFESLDEVLREVERLASRPYHRLGNWSLGQACDHLAQFAERSVHGFGFQLSWPLRTFGPLMKNRVLEKGFPAGVKLRGPLAVLVPANVEDAAGVARLREAVALLQREPGRAPSPLLGPLTRDEWDRLHLRHGEHHLSFLVPDAPG